ncbi:hypothetical protein ACNSOP_10105 [Aliarcobacter lanthieri]|uniref:hypothetical protein n=1 Tax=Aliarcobacter lanthieri TaxID=1355374 RepID=UPI003AAD528B
MEIFIIFIYIVLFIIAFILSFSSIKYFINIWKFKNMEKDGSEDNKFKRFD